MLNVSETQFLPFGKCVCISNGSIEIYVTVDVGPRIIRAGFVGGDNFMMADTELLMKADLGDATRYSERFFYNKGGHRCWLSPEAVPRVAYPDNKPVSYTQKGNTLIFNQCEQEGNDVIISFEITMSEDKDEISINHVVTNTGYWGKKFAVWPITVVAQNGVEYIPQNTTNTGLLPNRNLVMWSYTNYDDERLTVGNKYIVLRQDTNASCQLKLGFSQEHSWAAYFHHGDMFVKKYTSNKNGEYPDFGCTYETYTNSKILEMETLSELKMVEPGECNTHLETWQFFKNVSTPANDSEMDQIAAEYNLN
ncbi:MAG: hypothetical protein E7395_01465 [Ruminococcaceae bacterium]|nr:hypothetical protein [Oscillospiraceae bacterium]